MKRHSRAKENIRLFFFFSLPAPPIPIDSPKCRNSLILCALRLPAIAHSQETNVAIRLLLRKLRSAIQKKAAAPVAEANFFFGGEPLASFVVISPHFSVFRLLRQSDGQEEEDPANVFRDPVRPLQSITQFDNSGFVAPKRTSARDSVCIPQWWTRSQ